MGALNLQNLKPWKPGQSGNAGGRPKLPKELQGITSLTQLEVTKLISKYARMTLAQLTSAAEDKKLPILELAFISIFRHSVDEGDFTKIGFLLDRCIGKAPPMVEDPDTSPELGELQKLSLNQLVRLVIDKSPEVTAEK